VIGRLPGETSCLGLVWAVLDRASEADAGLTMSPRPGDGCRACAANSPAQEVIDKAVPAAA
jgi:hypothetical protein